MTLENKIRTDIKRLYQTPEHPQSAEEIRLTDRQLIKGGLIAGAISIMPGILLYYEVVPHIIKYGIKWPF